jgi:hypothetical protein
MTPMVIVIIEAIIGECDEDGKKEKLFAVVSFSAERWK